MKEPKEHIENYRLIGLTACMYKIFTKILLRRITKKMEENNSSFEVASLKNFTMTESITESNIR